MKFCNLFFWLLNFAIAFANCSLASAANIQHSSSRHCAFKIEGPIVSGDFERLAMLIRPVKMDPLDERSRSICLKSAGGMFGEALKISELVFSRGMSTVVEFGSDCFSACAIIFMSGVMPDQSHPYRKLSVGGVLGFHAPYIELPDQKYSKSDMENATQGMTKAILALVEMSSKETKLGGELLKKSLVQQILGKGKNEAFFIRTVFDAARWNIDLYDAKEYFRIEADKVRGVVNMCNNFHYSNMDQDVSKAVPLTVQIEDFSSKFEVGDFRILVKNSQTKDLVCEMYPKEHGQGRVIVKACSYDYWSSKSFGDCREYKTRPTFLIGQYLPIFFALDSTTMLKRFKR